MARPDGAPAINAGMTVVEGIGDLIQRRELLPGEPVRQQDMAERLNESRVSVREALRALETEGLLRHPPNQSYFVTKFGVGQLNQMYLMRRLLETALLRDIIWPDDVPLRAINAINEELRQASHDGEVSLLV